MILRCHLLSSLDTMTKIKTKFKNSKKLTKANSNSENKLFGETKSIRWFIDIEFLWA